MYGLQNLRTYGVHDAAKALTDIEESVKGLRRQAGRVK
jgi:hypothetical protein